MFKSVPYAPWFGYERRRPAERIDRHLLTVVTRYHAGYPVRWEELE